MGEPAVLPKTVEEISDDFVKRRSALLRALTDDVDDFFQQCDPQRDNLCLYGHADGNWTVDLPVEEVPPELPEPCLGINFARDGMERKDWLSLVAIHSDSWLMAVAFFYSVKLDAIGRGRLFKNINTHPTLFEVVSGRAAKRSAATPPHPPPKRVKQEDSVPRDASSAHPNGRFMKMDDISTNLKGVKGEVFWPDNKLWYVVQFLSVNVRQKTARVLYSTGEEEEVDLTEVIRDKQITLLDK